MSDDKKMDDEIEQALRGGNPDDAARVYMSYKHVSLDVARAEIHQRLKNRQKR
jgi:hypothetical protein